MPIPGDDVQVLEEMCPACLQLGRQLRRVRMKFNLARLHQEAAGVFDEPNVVSCLVCDPRMKTLFQKLQQHAPRVRPALTCRARAVHVSSLCAS